MYTSSPATAIKSNQILFSVDIVRTDGLAFEACLCMGLHLTLSPAFLVSSLTTDH